VQRDLRSFSRGVISDRNSSASVPISIQLACRSARRREQASETRQRIIRAAYDLFVHQGYGRTTIADVARTAGVAPETVYAAYRTKPALLRQVWYATMRGDEEDIRLLDRAEIRAVLAEPDLATRLRAHAVVMTPVFRRITPLFRALQGAATSDGGRDAVRHADRP
jgi:AcrR family transcriptional regulator